MRFDIEPKIGLGDFILGMNINQILTLINRNGSYFKNCKIISKKEKNTPIFLNIPSELITLRFNYFTQNLELIEKSFIFDKKDNNSTEANNESEYYYKSKLFYMQNRNKEFNVIKYENVIQLFKLSKLPKKLNNNKNIFLEYSGIGFYFTNIAIDLEKSEDLTISSEVSSVDTNSILSKLLIFREDSLYYSLNTKNIFNTNNIIIEYDTNNARSITLKKDDNTYKCVINIDENIEDVLRELKNPNYIYYCNEDNELYNQASDIGEVLYNKTSNKITYLNYFKYGLDIMICNNKVKRIILHANQIEDSIFGIYERCNFKFKLRKDYLMTLSKNDKNISEKNDETNSIDQKSEKLSVKEKQEKQKEKNGKNSQEGKIQINDNYIPKEKKTNKEKSLENINSKNIKKDSPKKMDKENKINQKEVRNR